MFNFIKIDGKFKEYFNGLTGKMESNSSNPNKTINALIAFLYSCASRISVRRSVLFNAKVPLNIAFGELFGESGPLNTRDKRDAFFEIMITDGNGVNYIDEIVTFLPEFSSRINSIVSQFLEGIDDSQSSSDVANSAGQPNTTVATAGRGAAFQKKTSGQPKEAVAIAGGGEAVCHQSKAKPKTLSDFIKESEEKKPLRKHLTCVLCRNRKPDGSGTCTSPNKCKDTHPLNPMTIVPIQVTDKNGKELLIANVCHYFKNNSCHNPDCEFAHLPEQEYDDLVAKRKAYEKSKKEESSKASRPEKLKKPPQILVPSQVGRPSQPSALPVSHLLEMTGYSFDPRDQFLGFRDLGLFAQWSSVVSEKKPDDVDFSHQPSAVEVSDSTDEKKNVEGDK